MTAIRNIEVALGDGIKRLSNSELPNKEVVGKASLPGRVFKKGEIFTQDNLAVKRPGNGISPVKWFEVLGMYARRDFCEDELIEL